jgi:tetratricopeptide (TPR) repeat protein
MLSRAFFLWILLSIGAFAVHAQTADSALYNKLGDFDLARLYNDNGKALRIGEEILTDTAKLTPKAKISFFGRLAKLYEGDKQTAKAIIYYEKVVAAVPDYYVAQRALGYLADSAAEEIHLKLFRLKRDDPSYNTLFDQYRKEVLKALPHLEKGQACDPNDDDLDMIRTLYQNIHDDEGLKTLSDRLAVLSKNCVDILSDN